MSNSIIEVNGLSKSYTISHQGNERYTALRDVIANKAKKIFSFPKSLSINSSGLTKEEFWALKNITFNIEQGDRIGIIGRNGAGKSTLLKILSRITEPTSGSIKIRGRVASLLEVGTGFHPELTGRENIFLNGAILGMTRAEIRKHFDAIVDFAETEKFLDTPVKRYSSGMYVRLAFAVAAHLESKILIVDEVLAVGDLEFQKKCLGKMGEVSKQDGKTVLFVSHNMQSIANLCNNSILLKNGLLHFFDKTEVVLSQYNKANTDASINEWFFNDEEKFPEFTPVKIAIVDKYFNTVTNTLKSSDEIYLLFEGNIEKLNPSLKIGYQLLDDKQQLLIASLHNELPEKTWPRFEIGFNRIITRLPLNILQSGDYTILIHISIHRKMMIIDPPTNKKVLGFNLFRVNEGNTFGDHNPGIIFSDQEYKKIDVQS